MSSVVIARLQIEHLRETLGIGTACPRLSWQVETSIQNWKQAAYEIGSLLRPGCMRTLYRRCLIDEIVSDNAARNAVTETVGQMEGMGFLFVILDNEKSLTLRQALGMLSRSDGLLAKIVNAIAGLGK